MRPKTPVAGARGKPLPSPVRRPRARPRKPAHSGGVGAPSGDNTVPAVIPRILAKRPPSSRVKPPQSSRGSRFLLDARRSSKL